MPKKRKRGRPPKSETLARRQAEREEAEERKAAKAKAAEPHQAEEEEDDIVDAGAIDDPEGQGAKSSLNPLSDNINTHTHRMRIIFMRPCHCSFLYLQRIVITTQQMRSAKEGHPPLRRSLLLFPPLLKDALGERLAARGSTAL